MKKVILSVALLSCVSFVDAKNASINHHTSQPVKYDKDQKKVVISKAKVDKHVRTVLVDCHHCETADLVEAGAKAHLAVKTAKTNKHYAGWLSDKTGMNITTDRLKNDSSFRKECFNNLVNMLLKNLVPEIVAMVDKLSGKGFTNGKPEITKAHLAKLKSIVGKDFTAKEVAEASYKAHAIIKAALNDDHYAEIVEDKTRLKEKEIKRGVTVVKTRKTSEQQTTVAKLTKMLLDQPALEDELCTGDQYYHHNLSTSREENKDSKKSKHLAFNDAANNVSRSRKGASSFDKKPTTRRS